jgi:hypothetical protein
MLVKLLYSALLAVVAVAASGELLRVWIDRRLYIGSFDYASGEAGAEEKGKAFGIQVGLAHALIFRQLQDYNQRGIGGTSDTTYNIGPDQQLSEFNDRLEDLALTYQNVNIGQLLAGLRKSLSQPNEVSGVVTKIDGKLWAKVLWPGAPAIGNKPETAFMTDTYTDEASAVQQAACGIAWAQVAARSTAVAAMGRTYFCQWARVLGAYSSLVAQPDDAHLTDVPRWRGRLTQMVEAGVRFPDIYRLRADLTDLLPADARLPLLVEAQNDRVTYALLTDPAIQKLPADERRLHAFALARPAIEIRNGVLEGTRDNWRSILGPHAESIERAAAAVGALRHDGKKISRATAFRIGRDLIMTVNFALNGGLRPDGAESNASDDTAARIEGLLFCEGDDALATCAAAQRFAVTGLLYDGGQDVRIAVLRIDDRGPADTLQLRDTAVAPDTLVDQYAYIIGYPYQDPRVPPALSQVLLGTRSGIKRLMPGRTLALEADPRLSRDAAKLTTDINTTGGTAGAPLIDLVTGRVIGVHTSGRWDEKKGKFTSAEVITPSLVVALQAILKPAQSAAGDSAQPAAPDAPVPDRGSSP